MEPRTADLGPDDGAGQHDIAATDPDLDHRVLAGAHTSERHLLARPAVALRGGDGAMEGARRQDRVLVLDTDGIASAHLEDDPTAVLDPSPQPRHTGEQGGGTAQAGQGSIGQWSIRAVLGVGHADGC
jgi:hypothetical protein